MTATNHDDRLGDIYPAMLIELNCTFAVSFSRSHCCGRHGLWSSWLVAVIVCGRHGPLTVHSYCSVSWTSCFFVFWNKCSYLFSYVLLRCELQSRRLTGTCFGVAVRCLRGLKTEEKPELRKNKRSMYS